MIGNAIVGLLAGLVLTSDHAAEKAVEAEFKRLQGNWVVTAAERDGQALDRIKGNRLSVQDRSFTIKTQTGFEMKGDLLLDPAQDPRHMDLVHQEGLLRDKTWQAIYHLDGDTLKICYVDPDAGKDRPREFATAEDSSTQLVVLERVKP
jgi:uncharacterized protein (TIGR03067 family)